MSKILTDNKYYSQIADVIREQNGTSNTYTPPQMVNALKDLFYEEVEGVPPISFNGIGENLLDYRIDGASGGVGDRTENLFFKKIENANIASNDGRIYSTESFDLWIGKVKAGETYTSYNTNAIVGFFTDEPDYGAYTYDNSRITNATSVFTFTVPNGCSYVGVRILKNEPTAMLNSGSTALPYEPYGYKVPVMVEGKNLLLNTATSQTINGLTFTVNTDGSVTCNGRREQTSTFFTIGSVTASGEIILSGCPSGGSSTSFAIRAYSATISNPRVYYEIGDSCMLNTPDTYNIDIRIQSNYACDNLTFYPMIRKADIEDDTYEPYHEPITTNIYLDNPILENESISLSDTNVNIPTIRGTNVLSIDTTVQPSNVFVKSRHESSYETAMRERYEEAQAQLDALESGGE